MTTRKNQKDLSATTDELNISDLINIKIKTPEKEKPQLLQIDFNLWGKAKESLTPTLYNEDIESMQKDFKKAISTYVADNRFVFSPQFITEFNATAANLKKGYQKYMSMTAYVKQKRCIDWENITAYIEDTISLYARMITNSIDEHGFECLKEKQK